ncbi:MAG: nucleoside monophosphate kinase [bacterium]|nr:nucleoside monophosphate kinase [bacterium]
MKISLVLFGYPGSGKGELAKFLASREGFDMWHVGTGEIFRTMLEDPKFHEEAKLVKAGIRVSDDKVIEVVHDVMDPENNQIEVTGNRDRIVWDGFPRSPFQAEALQHIVAQRGFEVQIAMELDASRETCEHRIRDIRAHEGNREDDQDVLKIHRRMDDYESYAPSTLEILKQHMAYVRIDASRDDKEYVRKQVGGIIKKLLMK